MAKKELTVAKLNQMYDEAEAVDKELFAEMRSHVLLVAGDHYSGKGRKPGQTPTRDDRSAVNDSPKLRLTKNFMHRAARIYESALGRHAPGVGIKPRSDSEAQDRKAAELNGSVKEWATTEYRMKERFRRLKRDFVRIGESIVVIKFDPNGGHLVGYEQAVDEETGEPKVDEQGELVAGEKPVMSGGFVFERTYGFNVMRERGAEAPDDDRAWIVRKMVTRENALALAGDDENAQKAVSGAQGEAYVVFDAQKKNYARAQDDEVCIREYYWPVSDTYPEGYWAIATSAGIMAQGKLPEGIWPIVYAAFDENQTSPRGRSILKVARPWQAELNRSSSAMAMHQVTIGDDKVIYQAGTQLKPGTLLPGVRGLTYQGQPPTVLPGRDGGQYLGYIQHNRAELDDALMMRDMLDEKPTNLDPYTLLFASASQQERFADYGETWEQFHIDFWTTFLDMARYYLPDDCLIQAVGKSQMINIAEFRETSPLSYKIEVEGQSETIETKLGRQLTLTHMLQYVGSRLEKDDIGRIARQMPFGNVKEAFRDFTIDEENSENDILALERGEMPTTNPYDSHEYSLKRLVRRMKERDFQFLPPDIQQNVAMKKPEHEAAMAEQAATLAAAKNEFIPTDGAMIACDMYIPDPIDPKKPAKRVRIPYRAMDWLVQHLEQQGASLEKLETQNKQTLVEVADLVAQRGLPQAPMSGGSAAGPGIGVS